MGNRPGTIAGGLSRRVANDGRPERSAHMCHYRAEQGSLLFRTRITCAFCLKTALGWLSTYLEHEDAKEAAVRVLEVVRGRKSALKATRLRYAASK